MVYGLTSRPIRGTRAPRACTSRFGVNTSALGPDVRAPRRFGVERSAHWDAETEARLIELRLMGGMSMSQIAEALNNGATRNAIIGKVSRFVKSGRLTAEYAAALRAGTAEKPAPGNSAPWRVSGSPEPVKREKAPPVAPAIEPAPAPLAEPAPAGRRFRSGLGSVAIPIGAAAATAALTAFVCRWPEGDPLDPDFHYCMEAKAPGGPYCPTHQARHIGRGTFAERTAIGKIPQIRRFSGILA